MGSCDIGAGRETRSCPCVSRKETQIPRTKRLRLTVDAAVGTRQCHLPNGQWGGRTTIQQGGGDRLERGQEVVRGSFSTRNGQSAGPCWRVWDPPGSLGMPLRRPGRPGRRSGLEPRTGEGVSGVCEWDSWEEVRGRSVLSLNSESCPSLPADG